MTDECYIDSRQHTPSAEPKYHEKLQKNIARSSYLCGKSSNCRSNGRRAQVRVVKVIRFIAHLIVESISFVLFHRALIFMS